MVDRRMNIRGNRAVSIGCICLMLVLLAVVRFCVDDSRIQDRLYYLIILVFCFLGIWISRWKK